MRTTPLLIVTAALLAGACGNQAATNPPVTTPRTHTATHPRSGSHTNSSTATTTTMTHTSSAPPLQALQTFAGAYGAYLDGRVPAATLPDATAAARAEVGPPIPAPRRAGTLALVAISQIAGGPSYIVSLRDRQHTFGAQLTLTATAAGWQVSTISPPDLDTILGPPTSAIPPPAGSAGAQHAARAFMNGYLAWLYRHGPTNAIADATPSLLTELKANPPANYPPAYLALAHVVALALKAAPDKSWLAYVTVNDGALTYDLPLTVVAAQSRWLVSKVGSPQRPPGAIPAAPLQPVRSRSGSSVTDWLIARAKSGGS